MMDGNFIPGCHGLWSRAYRGGRTPSRWRRAMSPATRIKPSLDHLDHGYGGAEADHLGRALGHRGQRFGDVLVFLQ